MRDTTRDAIVFGGVAWNLDAAVFQPSVCQVLTDRFEGDVEAGSSKCGEGQVLPDQGLADRT